VLVEMQGSTSSTPLLRVDNKSAIDRVSTSR
jgi:hypothetical protein